MTILQQPDTLSFSGNIKDFRIGTTDNISFILRQGNDEILSQSYEPGQDGIVTISLKDIIHSRLSFQLQETSIVYQQPNLVKTFTAVFAGNEVTFRAIRGGIDRLADTPTNFLTHNFLTWQPSVKPVTYYSPEFLTYYAVVTCTVKLHAYFTDDSGTVISEQVISLSTFEAGHVYTIPLQYASVAEKLSNRLPAYYDVFVEDTTGNRLTYIQRYYASDMFSEQEQWILFENSLGGIDTFRAYGTCDFTGDHTHNIAEINDISSEYRVDTERKFQKNTGHLNDKERRWLLDFFPSLSKYIYTGTYLRPIIVVESNTTYTDRDLPSNYTFTYKYADACPFLNLLRADIPSGELHISIPDIGSFTVPPRLVEFPRLPLSEGALFPIQEPYSEKWYTTTGGSLGDFIAERLSYNYGGGGGIGHQHKNIDLLQLLSYVDDYLLIAGKKIKAGFANETYTFSNNEAKETITFLKELVSVGLIQANDGINIGNAIDDFLVGKGIVMTPDGRIQCNVIEARQSAKFLELIYNRLSALEGDFVFSESGTIDKVEDLGSNTYRLFMRKRYDSDFTALEIYDILRGVANNLLSGGAYSTCWLRVIDKDLSNNSLLVISYPGSDVPGGVNALPWENMLLQRWGNTTKKERQRTWYLSSTEGRIVWLTGVTKPILSDDNYATFYGLPIRLKALEGQPINYDQPYMYARGMAVQDFVRLNYQGKPIYELVDRGIWSLSVAMSAEPYYFEGYNAKKMLNETSTVYHKGNKWQCLHTNTQQEPKWNATDWAFLEGNSNLSIDFQSSNGDSFFYGDVNTVVEARILSGNTDITDEVMSISAVTIDWSRDTGLESEDNTWNPVYVDGRKNKIRLAKTDMGSSWLTRRIATFKIEITIPTGVGTSERLIEELGVRV